MMHSHTNIVTHVKGLIALLYEYERNVEASDAEGNRISNGIFISTYGSGVSCFNNLQSLFCSSLRNLIEAHLAFSSPAEREGPRSR